MSRGRGPARSRLLQTAAHHHVTQALLPFQHAPGQENQQAGPRQEQEASRVEHGGFHDHAFGDAPRSVAHLGAGRRGVEHELGDRAHVGRNEEDGHHRRQRRVPGRHQLHGFA